MCRVAHLHLHLVTDLRNLRGFCRDAETVTTLPAFRDSILTKRFLIPADGFYEWRSMGSVLIAGGLRCSRSKMPRTRAVRRPVESGLVSRCSPCPASSTRFLVTLELNCANVAPFGKSSVPRTRSEQVCSTGLPRERDLSFMSRFVSLYFVQSSIFKCFNRRKERSLVTRTASTANA